MSVRLKIFVKSSYKNKCLGEKVSKVLLTEIFLTKNFGYKKIFLFEIFAYHHVSYLILSLRNFYQKFF